MSAETTPAIERAQQQINAMLGDDEPKFVPAHARSVLNAALTGPADDEGMDDLTMAIHIALCETSPEDCLGWRGPCVKAVEAAREALLGGAS